MHLRVGAYAVITDAEGRMLLPHWSEPGLGSGWTLPGGGVEFGEDPAAGVLREIFEETGYSAELDALLGIDNLVIPGERREEKHRGTPLQALRIIYRARITSGELRIEQNGSTDDVAWFTQAEVDGLNRVSLVDIARDLAKL